MHDVTIWRQVACVASIESQLEAWGGERLILQHDPATEAWIVVALHSSRLGPPTGGTRMRAYPDLESAVEDALRLSEGMTYKYAVAGFPRGGGKAVLSCPKALTPEARRGLLHRYGRLLQDLDGLFFTGPDVGTSPDDMDTIGETGAGYVFARTPAGGGAGSSGPYTALGVFAGIRAACTHLFGSRGVAGRSVHVQGLGSVGASLVQHLVDAGASVSVSDIATEAVERYRDVEGVWVVDADQAFDTPCDVFSPNALGGVLNHDVASRLRCRLVAGGANNQLASPDVGEKLQERDILYVPDFVVNIGGAMGITGIEAMGWTPAEAEARIETGVEEAVRRTLAIVASQGLLPESAARQVAEERLADG